VSSPAGEQQNRSDKGGGQGGEGGRWQNGGWRKSVK